MSTELPQEKVRKYTEYIYASSGERVVALKAGSRDEAFNSDSVSLSGDGTLDDPFEYWASLDVSPHFAIIDLWLSFRRLSLTRPVFIRVNEYILQIFWQGVRAENGQFTRLLI